MIRKVPVNSTCSVKSLGGMPCAAKNAIIPGGKKHLHIVRGTHRRARRAQHVVTAEQA